MATWANDNRTNVVRSDSQNCLIGVPLFEDRVVNVVGFVRPPAHLKDEGQLSLDNDQLFFHGFGIILK